MKKLVCSALGAILLAGSYLAAALTSGEDESEVLVRVGNDTTITARQLEQVLNSSPFYTQFNTMSEDQQASIRGDMLKRMVSAVLLGKEATAQGLDKQPDFVAEVDHYRNGLLYRAYMDRLRATIKIPAEKLAQMKVEYRADAESYSRAKAAYKASVYKDLRKLEIQRLRRTTQAEIFPERIDTAPSGPDTVLFTSSDGLEIRLAALVRAGDLQTPGNAELKDRLYQQAELLMIAHAAEKSGIDVSATVTGYVNERLPARLIEQLEAEWVPNDSALKEYYDAHPEVGTVPERWHVGQIVLANREEAEKLRVRIERGESLFRLAGEYSIDPYGRKNRGDMGWVRQGSGFPELEAALKELQVGQVSEVIETEKGFHIVKILDAQPGSRHRYAEIKDKIKQKLVTAKMSEYMQSLQSKYSIDWLLVDPRADPASEG